MAVENKGFLSCEIDEFIITTKKTFKITFIFCHELNEFAQKLLYHLNVRNRLINELIIGAAYTRLLSSFQGSILLAERGMTNEMKVLSRNFLEMVFLICATSKNEENARLFLLDDETQRKKLLKNYSFMNSTFQNQNILPEVYKIIDEVERNIKTNNIQHITTRHLAEEAKLLDHYKTYYAILSLSIHPSVRELKNTFTFNEKNEIVSINYGPSENDIEKILLSNCSYLLIAISNIKMVFPINFDEELTTLNTRFVEIWKDKYK